MLRPILSLFIAVFCHSLYAQDMRFEAKDPNSGLQGVVLTYSAQKQEISGTLIFRQFDMEEINGKSEFVFKDEIEVLWWPFSIGGPGILNQWTKAPPGKEFGGMGVSLTDRTEVRLRLFTTKSPNEIRYEFSTNPDKSNRKVVSQGILTRIGPAWSSSMADRLSNRLNPYQSMPEKAEDCVRILNRSCDSLKQAIANGQREAARRADPYYFLEPQWRLPVFGDPPKMTTEAPVTEEPPPFVRLTDKKDFPELVKLATIGCSERDCPSFTGLLLVLRENNEAAQCTTNYWRVGGWFSTNAHCIPKDLRKAGSGNACTGRLVVKMPESAGNPALTLDCEKIEYVSNFRETEERSSPADMDSDVAYFRVKNSELVDRRQPVEMNFGALEFQTFARVHMYAVNPVKEKAGLNGIIQKKSCTVQDSQGIRQLFPREFKIGYPIIDYESCDIPTIGGNSGAVLLNEAGQGVGWHQSTTTSARSTFHSATAARCFAPIDYSQPSKIPNYDGCRPISYDRIVAARLATKLADAEDKLKSLVPEYDLLKQNLDGEKKLHRSTQLRVQELSLIASQQRSDISKQDEDLRRARIELREQTKMRELERQLNARISASSKGTIAIRLSPVRGKNRWLASMCAQNPENWISQFLVGYWFFWDAIPSGEIIIESEILPDSIFNSDSWTDRRQLPREIRFKKSRLGFGDLRSNYNVSVVSDSYWASAYDNENGKWYKIERCD